MISRLFVVAAVVAALLVPRGADAKAKERYYLVIGETDRGNDVPQAVAKTALDQLKQMLAKDEAFVTELKGAPDPNQRPKAFKKYLQRHRLRGFRVIIKFTKYEDKVGPPKAGKPGQILSVYVSLQLLGTGLPDKTMALSGAGSSTVALEIGNRVRDKDKEYATEEAIKGALKTALDDAVKKLRSTPRAKPRKR